jgi:ParB-like chromosome segregation protein Spo0J
MAKSHDKSKLDTLFKINAGQRDIPGLKMIERAHIIVRKQVRKDAKAANIDGFREGISELHKLGVGLEGTGLLKPLIVSPAAQEEEWEQGELESLGLGEEDLPDHVVLKVGHRRFLATEPFLDELPCVAMATTQLSTTVVQLAENIQREGLDPLEEGEAFQKLQRLGVSIRDIAAMMGTGKGYVENRLNVINAGMDVQAMASVRTDTLIHARYIDKEKDKTFRKKLIEAAENKAPLSAIRTAVATGTLSYNGITVARERSAGGNSGGRGSGKSANSSSTPLTKLAPGQRGEKIREHLFSGKLALDRALAVLSEHGSPAEDQLRAIDNEVKALEERTAALRERMPELKALEPTRRTVVLDGSEKLGSQKLDTPRLKMVG